MRVLPVVISVLLLSSVFVVSVRADSTDIWTGTECIFINRDGSVSPSNAPIQRWGNHYTLTADMQTNNSTGIIINTSHFVFDGGGHTIQGTVQARGIVFAEDEDARDPFNVTIRNMKIRGFECGVCFGYTGYIHIHDNVISECGFGIVFCGSGDVCIRNNTIRDNEYGVFVGWGTSSVLYNNNFINNTVHIKLSVEMYTSYSNGFYNAYPIGGNYWDDYNGTDLFNGPYQNITGSDGIGDTPYNINYSIDGHNNTSLWKHYDDYPFMQPMGSPRVCWNLCDVNYDLKVDMRDVGKSARAFGTVPGDALWNPRVDVTGPESLVPDGKVDMRDISLIASHYGERYA